MMEGPTVIDGYAHSGLTKYRPIPELLEAMKASTVSRVVLVQHLDEYDNAYLASAIGRDPGRFAGVALIDPFASDWPWRIEEVVALGFRGLRFRVDWLRTRMNVAVAAAAAGLKLMIYVAEDMGGGVRPIRDLAQEASESTVVVAHLGAPRVRGQGSVEGYELLDLAAEANVWATLSGLAMFAPHPHSELSPFITRVIEAFGSRRLMWGSNFPVGLAAEPYDHDLELIRKRPWGLQEHAVADIVGRSAARLWFDSEQPGAANTRGGL